LQFFKTLVVILDGSQQGTPRHFLRDNKRSLPFRTPLFERTFCAPCTSASVETVLNNGGYLLSHTDASRAPCIDCGKLLSLSSKTQYAINHKANCSEVEMSCRKMPQRYTVHEESGIPLTRPTCKKAKLDEVLAAHCRADLMTECMKKKEKTLTLSGDFRFRFSAKNECPFLFCFRL